MSSAAGNTTWQDLQKSYPNIEPEVAKHIMALCFGNLQLAQQTCQTLTPDQIQQIKASLKGEKLPLTPAQKQMIVEFKGICSVKDETAEKFLNNNGWNLEDAINSFFSSGYVEEQEDSFENANGASSSSSSNKDESLKFLINTMFERYKAVDEEPEENILQNAGLQLFAKDLELEDTQSIEFLYLLFTLGAKTGSNMITRDEFSAGCKKLDCYSVEEFKKLVSNFNEMKKNESGNSRKFYRWLFHFSSPSKKLGPQAATTLWKKLFSSSSKVLSIPQGKQQLLENLCDYVLTAYQKPVLRDLWNEFYDFVDVINPDFSNYNMIQDCWNSFFDEFVDHTKN